MSEPKKLQGSRHSFRDLRALLTYFYPHRFRMLMAFVMMMSLTALLVSRPVILRSIIDNVTGPKDQEMMVVHASLFVLILILAMFISYWQSMMMAKVGLEIVSLIKTNIFERVLKLSLHFFNAHKVGWLISRVEGDTEQLRNFCSHLTLRIVADICLFFGVLGIMIMTDFGVALRIMPIMILLMVLIFLCSGKISEYFSQARSRYAELSGSLAEYLQAIFLIQLYDRKSQVLSELEKKSVARMKAENSASLFSNAFWGFFLFMTEGVLIAILVGYGAVQVQSGQMSLGTLVMMLEFSRQMAQPLHAIGENFHALQKSAVSASRVFKILGEKTEDELIPNPGIASAPPLQNLSFENVSFAYEVDKLVLKDISFDLKRGSRTALVGASGSGKSTTIQLLCRYFEPASGSIKLNGLEYSSFSIASCRKKVGLVLQDIFLFPGSVLDNIRVLDERITEEQVLNALNQIGGYYLIQKLPQGIHTELTERGSNLSMGERQLLSFARALCMEPELLILDEATASMDSYTERVLQRALETLLKDRTAVIIAHRLSTIRTADQILVFEQGEIVERGDHEALMRLDGKYSELIRMQGSIV